ncbi:unnamed protein product [Mytilus coruscus]|uniref:B box-type domain-containing protein n=1 Tax=Mytilus coruscus TaxID=42192 RepID=A0A6J8F2M8_MYTCO|nr:unnamed protein product [Mytilus coruscus]
MRYGEKHQVEMHRLRTFMCDKCKEERHFRIKNAQDHKVINIKDGLCNEELDFTNIQCPDHISKSCCLFCKRCDSLVCPTCVSEVHINHVYDLIEIRNAYNIKIDRLKQGQSKIKMEKEKAIIRKKHLEQHKNAEIVKHRKIIQNILNHGNMLKRTIDKYIQKLKNEIDENLKTVLKSTDTDIHIVSKSMRHVYEKYNEVGNFLKTRDIAKFFSNIRKIENSMEVTAPKSQSLYNSTPIFYPGEINQSNVGVLQMPEELSVAFDIIQEYQTKLSAVSDLISYVDDSIWINSALDNCVVKAEPKGKQLNVLSTLNLAVYGMAISPSNNLLLSVGKSRLQQLSISTSKLSDTVYNVKPLASTIIHITSSNKVIVGGVNEKLGRRAVFVMNEKGDHETVYEYDQHNQPIFTYPRSITSISTGNIHVVDREPGQEGRVVVLAPGSDIINSYIGHPKINKHKSFKPNRIVTTQKDNVMVTEMNTNTIHILDSMGNLVSWYNTKDIGILHPVSLSFTQTGQIYIGCGAEEGHTAKEAKIYKVTTSGC